MCDASIRYFSIVASEDPVVRGNRREHTGEIIDNYDRLI